MIPFRRALLPVTALLAVLLPCAASALEPLRISRDLGEEQSVEPSQQRREMPAGAQALRGPVDEDTYIVGPGDLFSLTIWAQAATVQTAPVNPEGELVLPGVATIPVAGKTLAKAKADIRAGLEALYRNVEVDVSLIGLRSIEINVIGNVVNPGTYVGTALDAASTLILSAGGLGENASRRNIRITRRSGASVRVDLTRYERIGDLTANPPIVDGDVIFVPFRKQEVLVDGGVEQPGVYEFVEGDTAGALIEIAGGLTRDARRDTLEVQQFIDDRNTREIPLAMGEAGLSWPLQDGDQVYVRRHTVYRPLQTVSLRGRFVFPGPYGITEGEDRILDVIERAGGFAPDASLAQARLIRTAAAEKIDRELERLQEIPVQDMSESEYSYFKSRTREERGTVVVDFERLLAGDESQNLLLQAGDLIVVPEIRETVTVSGAVTFPGLITFVPETKASYYVEQAGGYGSNADRGEAKVIKAKTGEWKPIKEAGVIVPGDEVWVPEKPDREWWEITKDIVAFTAQIAAIYLVIDTATR
jgi:protein involved in polysaccharide export with SLBB domain